MYGLLSTFEACRGPLTADELSDCVLLDSCGISDEHEAQAAICATGHDAECACVSDEDKCYEFVSAVASPDLPVICSASLTLMLRCPTTSTTYNQSNQEDVDSCPGLLNTYSELLFNSFMICLFGMIVGLFSAGTTFAKLCCCK